MFQGRKELLKSVITKDGFSGLINLAVRFAEERIKPEKIHFFASSAQIELTTACNLKCIMCLRSYSKQKTRLMNFNEFRDFLTGAPFLKVISFTGFGEIFLNPDWFKILSYSKQKGIYVWFNDNFTLMDKEKAAKLIDLNIDSIAVSFDAATKKTYEKIRIGADFDKVTQNIKHFVELKKNIDITRHYQFRREFRTIKGINRNTVEGLINKCDSLHQFFYNGQMYESDVKIIENKYLDVYNYLKNKLKNL